MSNLILEMAKLNHTGRPQCAKLHPADSVFVRRLQSGGKEVTHDEETLKYLQDQKSAH